MIQDQRLLIGASWYPEMWPETEWPKDLQRMRELGFTITRVFEFAWRRLEPADERYDFDWALRLLDLCHQHGIQAMIGTPTAAPPAWLTSKYPDVLRTHADGHRATHGQRRHYNVHSATYRELCGRIVSKMAEMFSDHPALHSWQIDNEMSGFDYGPESIELFHQWLARKYGTIEAINEAWGLQFWSQAYDRFDQIPMPVAAVGSVEVPERHHPSLIMAVAHFQNEGWTDFIRCQCDILRARSDKPITTNMTKGLGMQWYQHNRLLDRVGYSLYADVDHYPWQLWCWDRMRAEKPDRPYWLLETAPSWSAGGKMWNIHHDEKGVANISWQSILFGGSMVLYWQWREHWAGQEMQHGTLVTATGNWRPNKAAIARLAESFEQQSAFLLSHPPAPARLALMLSHENAWAFSIDPIDDNMRYPDRWRDDYHLPLVRHHWWRDVIDESADLSRYRVLLLPLMPMLSTRLRDRLSDWVRAGGRLLLGPLVGYRTEEFTAFKDQTFGGLEALMGAESSSRFTVHWVEDRVKINFEDGQSCTSRNWCEAFAPTGADILARYQGGYADGQPAVLYHRLGTGAVLTLGCQLSEKAYLSMVWRLCTEAGIEPMASGSTEVAVVPRADASGVTRAYAVLNLTEKAQHVSLPKGGLDRLTGEHVEPLLALAPLQVRLVEIDR